jgi:hypothetical protein
MQVDLAGNLEQSDESGQRELAFMANLLEERNFFLQKEAASSHPAPMASSLYSGDIENLICEAKTLASLLLRGCWCGAHTNGAVADGSLLLSLWSPLDFSVRAFETSVQNETMTPGMVSPASPSRRAHGLYFEAAAMNARALPIAAQVLACA